MIRQARKYYRISERPAWYLPFGAHDVIQKSPPFRPVRLPENPNGINEYLSNFRGRIMFRVSQKGNLGGLG
jgi:hypothetical protein